ncbi:MAG: sugar phosphate isomerase/epimerase family protein [Pirellulales bacterium]
MNNPQRTPRREFLGQAIRFGAAVAAAPCLAAGWAANAAAAPSPWQIGCYTRPWAAFDYRAALDDVAAAGFRHVGLMTTKSKSGLVIDVQTSLDEARRIGDEAKKRGLEIASVYAGGFPVEKSIEAGIAGLSHIIDACAAAGAKTLLLGGVGEQSLYEPYFKVVAECCDYAAGQKLGITIKPHGGLNATGPQLRKSVELVGKKNFSVWYDAGNILFYSDGKVNPVDDAATLDGLVTGWCVKDCSIEPKKAVDLAPGTGLVDFKGVLARLKKGGFRGGPLVIETLAPGDRPHLIEQATKARKFLEELVA